MSPEMCAHRPEYCAKRVRLIVIDDDPEYLDSVSALLQETLESVQVVGAFLSPAEALRVIEDLKPDVALVDVSMPGMGGITCAREITQRHPNTAVVMVSGRAAQLCCEEIIHCGASGFLTKPFSLPQLTAAIGAAASGLSVLTHSLMRLFYPNAPVVRPTSRLATALGPAVAQTASPAGCGPFRVRI